MWTKTTVSKHGRNIILIQDVAKILKIILKDGYLLPEQTYDIETSESVSKNQRYQERNHLKFDEWCLTSLSSPFASRISANIQ